jgi:hypothetical protein
MERHESAAWLYGFLAAVRSAELYAPPHVIEMVERVLERYESARRTARVEGDSSRCRLVVTRRKSQRARLLSSPAPADRPDTSHSTNRLLKVQSSENSSRYVGT